MLENFTNECQSQPRVHTVTMREIWARIRLGRRCLESVAGCDQNAKHCNLYQIVFPIFSTYLGQSMHSLLVSSHIRHCLDLIKRNGSDGGRGDRL